MYVCTYISMYVRIWIAVCASLWHYRQISRAPKARHGTDTDSAGQQEGLKWICNRYICGVYGCINILWCVYACVCVCISTYVQYVWVHVCICIYVRTYVCNVQWFIDQWLVYVACSHLLYITEMTGACVHCPPFCSVSRPQHMHDYRTHTTRQ